MRLLTIPLKPGLQQLKEGNDKMQIMFLMAGNNVQKNGKDYSLYLTEINEKLVLEQQISYCHILRPKRFIFCVKSEDIKNFHVDSVIDQLVPGNKIIPIQGSTKGAVCTALLGSEYIDTDEELILMAIDDFIDDSGEKILKYFRDTQCDAGVVSFKSVHPRYSFAKQDAEGRIIEFAEKRPISKNALVSFYYFKRGSDFVSCARDVIRKDNPVNGSFYISQTLNEMILKQKKIGIYKITNDQFHPLKTEAQLAQYLSELKDEMESK